MHEVQAAHERLWAVRRFLHDQEEAVPKELEQILACIHSYLLVKRLVRRDDHQVQSAVALVSAGSLGKNMLILLTAYCEEDDSNPSCGWQQHLSCS